MPDAYFSNPICLKCAKTAFADILELASKI